jgi:PAS domain S-box-containing protein
MVKGAVESAFEVYVDLYKEKAPRVLHVDDDADFLAVAKQCLEEQSPIQVDTASSAKEALQKLKHSKYDVIVSDYQMPGKNGLELLKELRQKGNDIPFILFTCKGKEEIAIEALNSGVYRYVGKGSNAETTYTELKHAIFDAVKGKKAEKLLREAENRFRQITENMQDMLLLTDTDLVCTYASASHRGILGYNPREMIGKCVYNFIHPDDLAMAMELAEKAFKDNSGGKMEVRVRRADGSYILAEGIGKILTDENGKINGVVITSREITKRKKAEEKLRFLKEFNEKIVDSIGDALFLIDPADYTIKSVNIAALKQLKLKKEDLIGKTCYEITHHSFTPCKSSNHVCPLHETLKTGKSVIVEHKHFDENNGELYVEVVTHPVRNQDGTIIQVLHLVRDITERKKISEKNRLQARLLNAVGQAIIATDLNGNITYWNLAAEKLYGWQELEVRGRNIIDVTPADASQEQARSIMARLVAGESWSGEFFAKRSDGAVFPAIITNTPITNDKGEVIGVIGVSTDISEQKWMQEVFNEAISKVVELNEKLRVVESLTRHDIRNKLSAINGRIFLLKKRLNDKPEALLQLKEMELASQQMLKIMEFEKVYVQVGSEELKNVDVERYVYEAASLFSDLKCIKLNNECRGLTVLADSLLRQLFYNLIDNSLKYGKKASVIRVHYQEETKQLKLIYEDDGVGVSDEEKKHLFQEGYGKGTGYGLYLIKRISEAYGWSIQETGQQGKGAQFTMTIPKKAKDGKGLYEIN